MGKQGLGPIGMAYRQMEQDTSLIYQQAKMMQYVASHDMPNRVKVRGDAFFATTPPPNISNPMLTFLMDHIEALEARIADLEAATYE